MIAFEHIKRRLAGLGKNRKWLAEKTGYSENTVRQYLGPKGKHTEDFLKEASDAIEAEEARQKLGKPESHPWNLIFLSHEEFTRADRASRIDRADTLEEFCRKAILQKADALIATKQKSEPSPEPEPSPAEETPKIDPPAVADPAPAPKAKKAAAKKAAAKKAVAKPAKKAPGRPAKKAGRRG